MTDLYQPIEPLTKSEIISLRAVVDAQILLYASRRESLAMTLDVDEKCRAMSVLFQRLSSQLEKIERGSHSLGDVASILELGFHPEPDHSVGEVVVYSILIAKRRVYKRDLYRWGELVIKGPRGRASLFTYETHESWWESLEGDADTLKTAARDIGTIGELELALHVATDFGRIDIRRQLEALDRELELADDPASQTEEDLSGTLKAIDHDLAVDDSDQISF
jgi:hypothetical protein